MSKQMTVEELKARLAEAESADAVTEAVAAADDAFDVPAEPQQAAASEPDFGGDEPDFSGGSEDDSEDVEFDFSQASEGGFEALPPGWYPALVLDITNAIIGSGENAGKGKTVFKFVIDGAAQFNGRQFFKHAPRVGKGAGFFRDIATGIGVRVPDATEGSLKMSALKAAIGNPVEIQLGPKRIYKGQDGDDRETNDVKRVRPRQADAADEVPF